MPRSAVFCVGVFIVFCLCPFHSRSLISDGSEPDRELRRNAENVQFHAGVGT